MTQQAPKKKSFGRELGEELLDEGKHWWRWTYRSAIVGAVCLGALGAVFFNFEVLLYGAAAGAVLGGIAGAVLYYQLTSL
jgi:uncharacterized protein (DUF2062 family)